MKISVIISTYNRPELLKRAIKSVQEQTFTDWELIIVHDEPYEPPIGDTYIGWEGKIKEFGIEHFGNDTKPKNIGILHATGDYIAFLDDDNEYSPDHLMILAKEAERNPSVDVLYGDRLVVSDDEEMEPQMGIASDFNPGLLMDRNYIDTSDVLVKRDALFTVGGFDERYAKYVDWNLWARMMKAGMKFLHIPKVITTYHLHKDMKSVRVKDENVGVVPFGDKEPQRIFKPAWDPFELEIILPFLKEQPLPKVAVFTLCKDRLDYTKRMYESLKKSGYCLSWFPVDQGSTDGTREWLSSLPSTAELSVYPIFNEQNTGISVGSNQALDAIGNDYDFILKIDNDCEILTNEWLDKLMNIFVAHWQIILSPYVEGLIDNPGGTPRLGYRNLRGHLIGITKHIGGIFVMAHKSAYQGFRWDKDDFLHGMQDVVFSTEMQKRGYLVGYIEDMKVSHIDTTLGQKSKYPDYFEKRREERTKSYKA